MKAKERIEKYLALAQKTTSGPWGWNGRYLGVRGASENYGDDFYVLDTDSGGKSFDEDFIAASRTEGPWMAKTLKRLIELVESGPEFDKAKYYDAEKFVKELDNEVKGDNNG